MLSADLAIRHDDAKGWALWRTIDGLEQTSPMHAGYIYSLIIYPLKKIFALRFTDAIFRSSNPKAVSVPLNGFIIYTLIISRVFRGREARSVPLGVDDTRHFYLSNPKEAFMPDLPDVLIIRVALADFHEQIFCELHTLRTIADAINHPHYSRCESWSAALMQSVERLDNLNSEVQEKTTALFDAMAPDSGAKKEVAHA